MSEEKLTEEREVQARVIASVGKLLREAMDELDRLRARIAQLEIMTMPIGPDLNNQPIQPPMVIELSPETEEKLRAIFKEHGFPARAIEAESKQT